MAAVAVGQGEGLVDATRDQRYLEHIGVGGGDGEQPDEPVLDGGGLAGHRLADHHDVGMRAVAQIAGHGRLGQHQQIVGPGELWEHVSPQPEYAQPAGRFDGGLAVGDRTTLVSELDEVAGGEPAQQRRHVPPVVGREVPVAIGVQLAGEDDQRGVESRGVQRHLTGVTQDARQQRDRLGDGLGIRRRRQLHVNPGLVDAVRRCVRSRRGTDVQQSPGRVAAHAEDRVHDRGVRDAEPVQEHRDGVHQHRVLVGDELDGRADPVGIPGRVDLDLGVTRGALPANACVRGEQRRRDGSTRGVQWHRERGVDDSGVTERPPTRREIRLREVSGAPGVDHGGLGRTIAVLPTWSPRIHRRHADRSCLTPAHRRWHARM